MQRHDRRKFMTALAACAAGAVFTTDARSLVPTASGECKVVDFWAAFQKKNKDFYPCALVVLIEQGQGKEAIELSQTKNRKLKTILSQLPVIFMPAEKKKEHFTGESKENNLLLVDLKGKILKSSFISISELKDTEALYKILEEMVIKDGTLTKLWEKFVKPDDILVKEVKEHFLVFKEGGYRERSKSRKAIREKLKQSVPVLFQLLDKSMNTEQRETCRDLLIEYSSGRAVFTGIPVKVDSGVRMLCGMASMSDDSRSFLADYVAAV